MGEIKSTLDLVMERTRHLTLSEEEKQSREKRDQQRRLQGLIQKFRDQALTQTELERRLTADYPENISGPGGLLEAELLRQVALDGDNAPILDLLQGICAVDPAPLTAVLDEYQRALAAARTARSGDFLEHLADTHQIRGTALIPNLTKDPKWHSTREALTQNFDTSLSRAKQLINQSA